MYLPIDPQDSCALAWLAATSAINVQARHEFFNVIVDITDPLRESDQDRAIIREVDKFLKSNDSWPLQSVANTIFPGAIYARHGSPEFYEVYLKKVYPKIKRKHGDWGRYFERMISYPKDKKGRLINPLRDIVDKMKEQLESDRCFKNVYELTIYDPVRDAGPVMNRQCLSFLSFKITDDKPRKLLLTAVYRNHYYITRLLGNLIGLSRLMEFVADETDLNVGSLTIVSTHAEVDALTTRKEIQALLENCSSIAANP